MAIRFHILPDLSLVYVRYEGFVRLAETATAFAEYSRHPAFAPGQRQLVDLSRITTVENDIAKILELQAQKAETFLQTPHPILMIYYAPTEISFAVARMIQKSWDGLDGVIARIQTDEAGVRDILGLPDLCLTELSLRSA